MKNVLLQNHKGAKLHKIGTGKIVEQERYVDEKTFILIYCCATQRLVAFLWPCGIIDEESGN
jgi:hypothetical protein